MAPAPGLDLPPPFRLVTLREVGDAMTHAVEIAPTEGAGTLVYVGRFDLAEFAVVLEPEEPLWTARRSLYAGAVALADALAVHAPPEKPITFDWPDAVRIDGGLVGGMRLEWPLGADENAPPPWLVFGAMIRTVAMGEQEPGLRPLSSALEDEGLLRSRLGQAGRELCAPPDDRDRRLAGSRLRRSREELFCTDEARERRAAGDRRERRSAGASHGQARTGAALARQCARHGVVARS